MESFLLSHPKLIEMQGYGLENSSQLLAASLTYLDLTEVKLWSEVEVHFCPDVKTVYLTGREKEEGIVRVVVPISSGEPLSMDDLWRLHSAIRKNQLGIEEEEEGGVTLALVGNDSSILYCTMWHNIHLSSSDSSPH